MPDLLVPNSDTGDSKASLFEGTAISRRKLLAFAAAALVPAVLYGIARRFGFLRSDTFQKFDIGTPSDYVPGKVDGRWRTSHGVWIVRTLDGLYALSVRDPEGQLTEWDEKHERFRSPAGNRLYYKSGICYRGTQKTALRRVAVSRTDSGRLLVDPGRELIREKGEWNLPESFSRFVAGTVSEKPMRASVPVGES